MINAASNKPDDAGVAHAIDGFGDDVRLVVEDLFRSIPGGKSRAQAFDLLMDRVRTLGTGCCYGCQRLMLTRTAGLPLAVTVV